MLDRFVRQMLAVIVCITLVSSSSTGEWDVGIMRAAKKASEGIPSEKSEAPSVALTPGGSEPEGFLDIADKDGFIGWACDKDDYSQVLSVHIYANGPAGVGTMVANGTANILRESGVGDACGGYRAHGFVIPIPENLKDNKTHAIYAYGINPGGGNNPQLHNVLILPALAPESNPQPAADDLSHVKYFGMAQRDSLTAVSALDWINLVLLENKHKDQIVEEADIKAVSDSGKKSAVSVANVFFVKNSENPSPQRTFPDNADYVLRPDYNARWEAFKANAKLSDYLPGIAAFYLMDEPYWNNLTYEDIETAAWVVKRDFPTTPIGFVEAFTVVEGLNKSELRVPEVIDWVGFDKYGVRYPSSDTAILADLAILKIKMISQKQRIIFVGDNFWASGIHGKNGITQGDMASIFNEQISLAKKEPRVVAFFNFIWDAPADFPGAVGAGGLPASAQNAYSSVGRTILANPVGDITPPGVTILEPLDDANVADNSNLTISVAASDNKSIQGVEFYVDKKLMGTKTAAPFRLVLPANKFSVGNHRLEAIAFDVAGNSRLSASKYFNVTINTGSPLLSACPRTDVIHRDSIGSSFSCSCSASATQSGSVWGTDVYMDFSSPCRAALHAGVITSAGGNITYRIDAGQLSYVGSSRNGVISQSNSRWLGSFSFPSDSPDPSIPSPLTGTITVNSSPSGARVWHSFNGGEWLDSGHWTPVTITGRLAGEYKGKLVKEGYVDTETAVQTLTAGRTVTFDATLVPNTGNITVNSSPAGAQIWYSYNGGEWLDSGRSTPFTFTGRLVGKYKGKLVKEGYVDVETAEQTLTGGSTVTFGATLVTLASNMGTIKVDSSPSGARVWYSFNGGEWLDSGRSTPVTFSGWLVGKYKGKLVKEGYVDAEMAEQTLTGGRTVTFGATLVPNVGNITVNSTPPGARVWYSFNGGDWIDSGRSTPFTLTGRLAGTYKGKLVKAGYWDEETLVQTLTAGGTVTFDAVLVPNTGNLTVNSSPSGARVWYSYNGGDWIDSGRETPTTFTGRLVGTYKGKLVKAGYADAETLVQTLTAGSTLTFDATLTSNTGNITVNSSPSGARVWYSYNGGGWIDSGRETPTTFTGRLVGTYKGKLVKAGYADAETAVQTLTGGSTVTFDATLTSNTGNITVNSSPSGARVWYSYNGGEWIDSRQSTPVTFPGRLVGAYKGKLVKDGYVDAETAVQTLTAGSTVNFNATLTSNTGNITVNSSPSGARVWYSYNGGIWIDSGRETPATFTGLLAGNYKGGLVKAGYADAETAVQTLTAGSTLTFDATLTPNTGTITVESSPPGARVWYSFNGGEWIDSGLSTPITLPGRLWGTYKGKLVKAGYADAVTAVQTLTPGGTVMFNATLSLNTGNITVNSSPSGARVWYSFNGGEWIDSGLSTPATFYGRLEGAYRGKLVKAGYADGFTSLQLTPGDNITVNVNMTQ